MYDSKCQADPRYGNHTLAFVNDISSGFLPKKIKSRILSSESGRVANVAVYSLSASFRGNVFPTTVQYEPHVKNMQSPTLIARAILVTSLKLVCVDG